MFNIFNPTKEVEKQRVTIIQAARHLGITRQYVYKLIKEGKLVPHEHLGRKCLYLEQCVLPKKKLALPNTVGGYRKRRTKEEIKREKARIAKRRYAKRKKAQILASLSPEERLKLERKLRNTKMRKYRRKKQLELKKSQDKGC